MKLSIFSCIILAFLASCSNREHKMKNNGAHPDTTLTEQVVSFTPQQMKSAGIETGNPQVEHLSGLLNLQGTIDVPPQNIVSLSFPLGGYLKSTKMLPGMHVKKGQLLAVLEDIQFIQLQQDYLTARTRFYLTETEFNRQQELNASKASSDKVYQEARSEMEIQRILMNALSQKLRVIGIDPASLNAGNISKNVSILSPIDGFVSKVNVNVGKYTAPTDILFELVDPRDFHLVLNVFEKDLNLLSVGQQVMAYTNNNPERKLEAEIKLVNNTLDQDRVAQVHCHFRKYDASLVPGMFMNAEVSLAHSTEALTVPEGAVVRWENRHFVFRQTDSSRFEMVEVMLGVLNHDKQQISGKGINSHTRLVVKNAYALLLKIKNTEEQG